ncbi:unnamed protein product [Camellia sinensis]
MSPQLFQSSLAQFITLLLIFIICTKSCHAEEERYNNCRSHPYNCGSIQGVKYPFWGDERERFCGRDEFQLKCINNQYPIIQIDTLTFRVLKINTTSSTMTIARNDLWNGVCPKEFRSTALKASNLFTYDDMVRYLYMFYGCTSNVTEQVRYNFTCPINGSRSSGAFFAGFVGQNVTGCDVNIVVPVLWTAYEELWNGKLTLQQAFNQGFNVVYNPDDVVCSACEASGGICGSGFDFSQSGDGYVTSEKFLCFCQDQPHPLACDGANRKMRQKLTIGASAAGMGMLLMCIIICCYRRKLWSKKLIVLWKKKTENDQNLESFIRHYKSLAPKRYSYSDVKKITNSFRDKLGQGGYGSVYKGKLLDGRLVAVKILNASKGNGEEFINEVASISRTSHVNVVAFLGFCLEGGKRALIYELMPNGSLEKFIYGENPLQNGGHLGLEKLYQIAVGIARGLEYLHRGCKTRILHFDIKPHNILLDEEFCPKISDFGLAKLCTTKESIVSMVGARGTIGYIAPEVFSRNFGGVSHKSDVYSYGMMVLEMVGGRRNVNVAVDHSSEIYFPHWIYKRLEQDEDLGLHGDMTTEEGEITRKMILVGLWCIQTDPSQRPSMSKVVEMLEGGMEGLEIPPKPYLSSPSRPPMDPSITSSTLQLPF